MYKAEDEDEDYYDGYSFGDEDETEKNRLYMEPTEQNLNDSIYSAIVNNKVNQLDELVDTGCISIDQIWRKGETILMTACALGKLNIIYYLMENFVSVNKSVDTYTPLMVACNSSLESKIVMEIVEILIYEGADVNVKNNFGMNALMFAIKKCHDNVAKHLIRLTSLEDKDNQGWTALFHAIENNRPEIVKTLLDAGVNTKLYSIKGYTPHQVALFHGFQDIVELLPVDTPKYIVPPNYLSFNTYEDLAPKIFLQKTIPNYFQDILPMLVSMKCESLLPVFAMNNVDLEQFLVCTDEDLQRLGIGFEFERKRILHGLYKFHLHKWNRSLITTVPVNGNFDLYDLYELIAAYLRHIVILKTSITFVHNNVINKNFGNANQSTVLEILTAIKEIKKIVRILKKRVNYINSLNNKPPLYIVESFIDPHHSKIPFLDILKYSVSIAFTIFLYAVKDY